MNPWFEKVHDVIRRYADQHEIEFRVGVHRADRFEAGLDSTHVDAVNQFAKLFQQFACDQPETWTVESRCGYHTAYYADNVRQRAYAANQTFIFVRKTRVVPPVDLDVHDRMADLRLAVSAEEKLDPAPYQALEPHSIHYMERVSATEQIPLGPSQHMVRFRYDVSQVSPAGRTKKDCSGKLCTFHIELELEPVERKVLEHASHLIARLFCDRALSLAGTHNRDKQKLPMPFVTLRAKQTAAGDSASRARGPPP